jgi:hypothetical protein
LSGSEPIMQRQGLSYGFRKGSTRPSRLRLPLSTEAARITLQLEKQRSRKIGRDRMAKKVFFVEQREDKRYNVTEKGVKTPFAVTSTQAKGIDAAKGKDPDAAIHVERVRDVGPGRDKWRKI